MAELIFVFADRQLLGETAYQVRVVGRPMGTIWEGWIEFAGPDGRVLRTPRETTQPNREALVYWASGLSLTYFEGAFVRAEAAEGSEAAQEEELAPHEEALASDRDRIAPDANSFDGGPETGRAILDPYSVAAKGEELLRSELFALSAWHLRNIVRAYELTDHHADLESMSQPELVALIVDRVIVT